MPPLKFLLLVAIAVVSQGESGLGQEDEVAVSVTNLGGVLSDSLDEGVLGIVDTLNGAGDTVQEVLLQALQRATRLQPRPTRRHTVRRPPRPPRVPRKNKVAEAIDNISDQLSTTIINSFQRIVDALDNLTLKVAPAENKTQANTGVKSNSA